jgi:hypothetical protein
VIFYHTNGSQLVRSVALDHNMWLAKILITIPICGPHFGDLSKNYSVYRYTPSYSCWFPPLLYHLKWGRFQTGSGYEKLILVTQECDNPIRSSLGRNMGGRERKNENSLIIEFYFWRLKQFFLNVCPSNVHPI